MRETRIHFRVTDIFRMKLRLNPVLESGLFNLFHLAGTGPESKLVEGVQDGFFLVQFVDGKLACKICLAALVVPARRRCRRK